MAHGRVVYSTAYCRVRVAAPLRPPADSCTLPAQVRKAAQRRRESPLTQLLRLEQMCRAGSQPLVAQSVPEYAGCAQLQMRSHSVEDHRRRSSSSELLSPVNFFHKVRAPFRCGIDRRGRRDSDGDSTLQKCTAQHTRWSVHTVVLIGFRAGGGIYRRVCLSVTPAAIYRPRRPLRCNDTF